MDIEPGRTTAIVGSSGGGKSTIISLILRYYDTNDGQVCIDGIPVTDLNLKFLRDQIGLVSQEPVLFGVSIAENIRYGRSDVTFAELIEASKQANAHEFVMKLPKVSYFGKLIDRYTVDGGDHADIFTIFQL